MPRSNVQIIQAHYDASTRGDIAGMMADVSPSARWTEMAGFPCAGTWIGFEQLTDTLLVARAMGKPVDLGGKP